MIDPQDISVHAESCEDLAKAAPDDNERTKWEGRAKLFLLRAMVHELRNVRETIVEGARP